MVLSLREPIAVAAWLVQAAGASALPDTIVTKQVALSRGFLGTVTDIATIVIAIAVIILVAVLIPAALSACRTAQVNSVRRSTLPRVSSKPCLSIKKNQFPPQAISPQTRPKPGTSTETPAAWR